MKLTQYHHLSVQVLEIGTSSLKIREGFLFRKTEEILFQDIVMKDLYELKFHNKKGLAYVSVCISFFVFFVVENIFNPGFARIPQIIVTVLTVLSIISYMRTSIKIYIPTLNHGTIKLFKARPSAKAVEEFLYVLEGKVKLAEKKTPQNEDLSHFLKRDRI